MLRTLSLFLSLFLALACAQLPQPEACRLSPLTPFQPAAKIEEGERALESQTFQASLALYALGPNLTPHFVDAVNRIRRIAADGRVYTVAGNGNRTDVLEAGPALDRAMPAVSQLLFSPSGVLHFVAVGRVWKVADGQIQVVAGSGRNGFNGEAGPAAEVNLGAIVNAAFTRTGDLLLIDGFARVRRLAAGETELRTVAGSVRPSVTAGAVGDGGPAVDAALNNPRQVFPFPDGSFWIRDLGGRQLRLVSGGIIRTVNNNFDASITILPMPDGSPAATTANRVYPIRPTGTLETGAAPFPPFTGAPLAIDAEGALHYVGNERPELRNPLLRLRTSGGQAAMASAPTVALVDGQAPPFGLWFARTGSLVYSASIGGKTGIVEARPGQSARFLVGGGSELGDADGKQATDIALFGIASFTVDGQNRLIVADASRQRILVVGSDGKVQVLQSAGAPVRFAPLGAFGTHQRITADAAGNIYWYERGGTPTGGAFTADLSVWRRSDGSLRSITVPGLVSLFRLEDGSAAVIAGNATNFRSVRRISPDGLGEVVEPFFRLPLTSVVHHREVAYFTAASRLFRGTAGRFEMLDLAYLSSSAPFNPSFVASSPEGLLVRLGDSGFYRLADPDACRWLPQPRIDAVSSAAGFVYADSAAPFQWVTVSGPGFGPPEGQGYVLNGLARAASQGAPYPALNLGSFTGAIPQATLTGTALPVIYSSDTQTTVQLPATLPLAEYLLYFSWQGLQLIHPTPLRMRPALPSLFVEGAARDGVASALLPDGSRHSEANPAPAGGQITLLATGLGVHSSTTITTGDFYPASPLLPVAAPVQAWLDEQPISVLRAAGLPGALAGAYAVTVELPADLPPGAHRLRLAVNGFPAASDWPQVVTLFSK